VSLGNVAASSESMRAIIDTSWRRVALYGLDPGEPLDNVRSVAVNTAGRLTAAAGVVLDEITRELDGNQFAVLLADSHARIVDVRVGSRDVHRALESVHAVPGAEYIEETTGTNAIATAFELRRGVAVSGKDHFLEGLRAFSCYGHPIFNVTTRRLEGVLDITCPVEHANPLLRPLIIRAVREIEQRLLDSAKDAEVRMLASFQAASRRFPRFPVMALGAEIALTNRIAADMVTAADQTALRALGAQLNPDERREADLTLTSGLLVHVNYARIPGAEDAVLYRLIPQAHRVPSAPRPIATRDGSAHLSAVDQLSVFVHGEAGSGRTTVARSLRPDDPVTESDASDLATGDEREWLQRLACRLERPGGLVIVESIHLLSPLGAAFLAERVGNSRCGIALTSVPVSELSGEHLRLARRCAVAVPIAPLRARRDELPGIVQTMVDGIFPGQDLTLASRTVDILLDQPWRSNLRELRDCLAKVSVRPPNRIVAPDDLPAPYRLRDAGRPLPAIRQIERHAIMMALNDTHGNKFQAAKRLGISRSTLYRRVRELRIST
jgi:sigma-54 dependent transcriptional regulator, acetoin dehydrogenase operon transcriptional activator AcoR